MKKIIAGFLSIIIAFACVMFAPKSFIEPIEANAFHLDFWNYEKNCLVVFELKGYHAYKVVVSSEDGKRYWTNDVSQVHHWYSPEQLTELAGCYADGVTYGGYYIYADCKKSLLNDETYFAKFVTGN